jgi:hypothetical protein
VGEAVTDEEFSAMIEEEAAHLERFGMTETAERMRACRTLRQAIEVHNDVMDVLTMARVLGAKRRPLA